MARGSNISSFSLFFPPSLPFLNQALHLCTSPLLSVLLQHHLCSTTQTYPQMRPHKPRPPRPRRSPAGPTSPTFAEAALAGASPFPASPHQQCPPPSASNASLMLSPLDRDLTGAPLCATHKILRMRHAIDTDKRQLRGGLSASLIAGLPGSSFVLQRALLTSAPEASAAFSWFWGMYFLHRRRPRRAWFHYFRCMREGRVLGRPGAVEVIEDCRQCVRVPGPPSVLPRSPSRIWVEG